MFDFLMIASVAVGHPWLTALIIVGTVAGLRSAVRTFLDELKRLRLPGQATRPKGLLDRGKAGQPGL